MTEAKSINSNNVISKSMTWLFYLSSFLNVMMNYLGSPLVKYIYIIQIITLSILCLTEQINKMIWPFVIFSLFEGQGRVVWGYNPIFRLIFDILLVLITLRGMIMTKSFFSKGVVPNSIRLFFILHVLWFCLELVNPNGAGVFASLATAKYYVFPILLFFLFLNFPPDFNSKHSQKSILLFFIFTLFLAGLTIVQNIEGDVFMDSISMNYKTLFPAYDRFRGTTFRPWGTTFVPGGMGVYYFLSCGLLFLLKPKLISSKMAVQALIKLSIIFGFCLILYSSFIGQVRSATLKLFAVILIFYFFKFISSRAKAIWIIGTSLVISLFLTFGSESFHSILSDDASNLEALNRWEGLTDSDITSHRAGFNEILYHLEKRVELPFGYGPGMTQSFLPAFAQRRAQYYDRPQWYFWSMDNLIAFLFLELGIGALFYIFLIFSVNTSLFSMMVILLRRREFELFSMVSLSFTMIFIITIFAWGSVSIPFNPVSFYFWFWASLGISHYIKYRLTHAKNISPVN